MKELIEAPEALETLEGEEGSTSPMSETFLGWAVWYWLNPDGSQYGVKAWVNLTSMEQLVDAAVFRPASEGPPSEPVYPPPTAADILASQSAKLAGLTRECNLQKDALTRRIATIQDAIDAKADPDAEEFWATPEEEIELPARKNQLTKWKQHGILLGRVTSQIGWPTQVAWPTKPTGGMDISSSVSESA